MNMVTFIIIIALIITIAVTVMPMPYLNPLSQFFYTLSYNQNTQINPEGWFMKSHMDYDPFGILNVRLYYMTNIKKITKNLKINRWNGLTRKEGFDLEKDCLTILNSNFECLCDVKCSHFPKIISCNPDKYKFKLSNCGYSLNKYELLVKTKKIKPIIIKNMDEQIECIIYNLKKCKIKHLDMVGNGKNICINNKGIISLIDFDIASIDNNYKSEKIKNRANAYDKDTYYIKLKTQIISIISKIIK